VDTAAPRARLPDGSSSRPFFALNAVVSVTALATIAYLLLVHRGRAGGAELRFLPAVNAALNGLSASFLLAGFVAIRRRAVRVHRALMTSALVSSSLFLASYLAYHYVHGDSHYPGTGWARGIYLLVLGSHVLLSIAVVPMALSAFYFAWRQAWHRHTRVTRILFPIWLYVSATGVLIFVLLRAAGAA
jgi:putative membrane protein